MPHPKNKHERSQLGKRKGRKRIAWKDCLKPSNWTQTKWDEYVAKQISLHEDTTKLCSCDGCCNPRNAGYGKNSQRLTLQEKRQLESENMGI